MPEEKEKKIGFNSKARTLEALSEVITTAKILPVFFITVNEFRERPTERIAEIQKTTGNGLLIVRSSSLNEDQTAYSNAGHFKSILNVPGNNAELIKAAINEVICSYGEENEKDEVLVQPQLKNIKMAGVAFTSDINTLAPYYIINYDESGSSESVTSGTSKSLKTFVLFKDSPVSCTFNRLAKLITTLKELESIFNFPHLDVEFGFDSNEELYIFQARPISVSTKENLSGIDFKDALLKIHKKITKLSSAHPNLLGDHAMYGVMPDWNPAEIIGLKPKHLAASLYKEIITDSIWAYQRDNYGYRNLRSHPLMLLYLGVPYIDVRVDFNSFIPKDLDEHIARKLVDHYLKKLISRPTLHDKVEFQIVHSCFYFNLPRKLEEELLPEGFTKEEIEKIEASLLYLTNKVLDPECGLYKKDIAQIVILENKYDTITGSGLSSVDKIYWLIEDLKRYGTLPFAGIARSAFIATQFMRSFLEMGIFSNDEYNIFVNSFNTVTKELNNDLFLVKNGKKSERDFLKKYGHLRPGTYDILSERYDEKFNTYFSEFTGSFIEKTEHHFSAKQMKMIEKLILKCKLKIEAPQLIEFMHTVIEAREYSKFTFTRSLSKALALIEELAVKYRVNRDDLSFLNIKTVMDLYANLDYRDIKEIFEEDIKRNKRSYEYTKAVRLPNLITKADDVYFHFIDVAEPNFVTMKKVTAPVVNERFLEGDFASGKIVFIRSADPGFDFLFTKNIVGLVTQFGGANSHMAVRCAELGIPAIIGAGETNFNSWIKSKVLEIDCLNHLVRTVS